MESRLSLKMLVVGNIEVLSCQTWRLNKAGMSWPRWRLYAAKLATREDSTLSKAISIIREGTRASSLGLITPLGRNRKSNEEI